MFKKILNKGFINIAIIIFVVVILVGGIIAWQILKGSKDENKPNQKTFGIPQECQEFQEDICGLFSCMVKQCWCDEGVMPNPISENGNNISNETEALGAVKQYLQETNSEYKEVKNAIKINDFFFNVFAYNSQQEEKVFTIGANGIIILTVCGM